MRTFYAVFDTNVLVSALMSKRADSPTVLLLDYVLDGRIVLLYNEDIIREYKEVLHRSKFDFSEDSIHDLIELVKTGLFLNRARRNRDIKALFQQLTVEEVFSFMDAYELLHSLTLRLSPEALR